MYIGKHIRGYIQGLLVYIWKYIFGFVAFGTRVWAEPHDLFWAPGPTARDPRCILEFVLEYISEYIDEYTPKYVPKNMPKCISKYVLEYVANHMNI